METLVITSNSLASINNMTSIRSRVIAKRTSSDMMGLLKAQMIETLKAKMQNGVAHFVFEKKDGSVREAWGTIQSNLVKAMTNGRGTSREAYATCAYFDVECGAWRSFRWENMVKVF